MSLSAGNDLRNQQFVTGWGRAVTHRANKFLGKGAKIPFLAVITSRTINIVINK